MKDARDRARDLMALAVGTPYSEEGRTAAIAAVKLILKEEMLSPKATPQGLGLVVAAESDAQRKEIEGLKREIEQLRRERAAPPTTPAVPVSVMLDIVSHLREIEALKREVARLRAMPRLKVPGVTHVVQVGDSPAKIAQSYTGSWKRLPELVAANPQKPTYLSNGWRTFVSLVVGERLRLPALWTP